MSNNPNALVVIAMGAVSALACPNSVIAQDRLPQGDYQIRSIEGFKEKRTVAEALRLRQKDIDRSRAYSVDKWEIVRLDQKVRNEYTRARNAFYEAIEKRAPKDHPRVTAAWEWIAQQRADIDAASVFLLWQKGDPSIEEFVDPDDLKGVHRNQKGDELLWKIESQLYGAYDVAWRGHMWLVYGKNVDRAAKFLADAAKRRERVIGSLAGMERHPMIQRFDGAIAKFREDVDKMYSEVGPVRDKADADLAKLDQLTEEVGQFCGSHRQIPRGLTGIQNPSTIEAFAAEFDAFEAGKLVEAKAYLQQFEKSYGASSDAVEKKFTTIFGDLLQQTGRRSAGEPKRSGAGRRYGNFKAGIEKVGELRRQLAAAEIQKIQVNKLHYAKGAPAERADAMRRDALMAEGILKLDPSSAAAKALTAELQMAAVDRDAEYIDEIDNTKWAERKYSGSDGDELEAAALEWLQKNFTKADDKVDEPVAVVITGNWFVYKENILSEPLIYGLRMHAGVMRTEEGGWDRDHAVVFSLTLYTEEKRNPEKAPPFVSVSSGSNWEIRPENVPIAGGGFLGFLWSLMSCCCCVSVLAGGGAGGYYFYQQSLEKGDGGIAAPDAPTAA